MPSDGSASSANSVCQYCCSLYLLVEVLDASLQRVYPQADVIQRGNVHFRSSGRIDRLHQVHLHPTWAFAKLQDSFVNILSLQSEDVSATS